MLFNPQLFRFAATAAPAKTTPLLSVQNLIQTGASNLVLSPQTGLDYEKIINTKRFGVTN